MSRIAYWTGESRATVRRCSSTSLIQRAAALDLRVRGLEASTLIELTAFGTAVMMNYRLHATRCTRNPPRRRTNEDRAAAHDGRRRRRRRIRCSDRSRQRCAAVGTRSRRVMVDDDGGAGRSSVDERVGPTWCSTSPSRSAARARWSRTSPRCSTCSISATPARARRACWSPATRALSKKVLQLSRDQDAAVRDGVSRRGRLGRRCASSR